MPTPVSIFIDTDMSIDVDDVGALCMAHALADAGEATLLAVVHSTAHPKGVGAIASINQFYARDVPIGAYRGVVGAEAHTPGPAWTKHGRGVYVDALVEQFPAKIRDASEAPDALDVYLETLRAAEDGSVVVVCIGHTTNLLALLLHHDHRLNNTADTDTADDGASGEHHHGLSAAADDGARSSSGIDGASGDSGIQLLSGIDLLARKVKRLVLMGGRRRPQRPWEDVEWNIGGCGGAGGHGSGGDPAVGCGGYDTLGAITAQTLALWPASVPITYLGFEAGVDVHTGLVLKAAAGIGNPCRQAYVRFCALQHGWCEAGGRASWDPSARHTHSPAPPSPPPLSPLSARPCVPSHPPPPRITSTSHHLHLASPPPRISSTPLPWAVHRDSGGGVGGARQRGPLPPRGGHQRRRQRHRRQHLDRADDGGEGGPQGRPRDLRLATAAAHCASRGGAR